MLVNTVLTKYFILFFEFTGVFASSLCIYDSDDYWITGLDKLKVSWEEGGNMGHFKVFQIKPEKAFLYKS